MEGALAYSKELLQRAQAQQQTQANKYRRTVDFEPEDKVYMIKKG